MHSSPGSADGGIVSMFKIIECEFSTTASVMVAAAQMPLEPHEKDVKEAAGVKTTNGQDAKYPTKACSCLDKMVGALTYKWSGGVDKLIVFDKDLVCLDKKCIRQRILDLELTFNEIAPFALSDTAKQCQDFGVQSLGSIGGCKAAL